MKIIRLDIENKSYFQNEGYSGWRSEEQYKPTYGEVRIIDKKIHYVNNVNINTTSIFGNPKTYIVTWLEYIDNK